MILLQAPDSVLTGPPESVRVSSFDWLPGRMAPSAPLLQVSAPPAELASTCLLSALLTCIVLVVVLRLPAECLLAAVVAAKVIPLPLLLLPVLVARVLPMMVVLPPLL